ncbi:haloacid dehalogenase-like hydrolase [Tieghemostelium lacteum]|uniref:Haloacid dehalogenase-like hydrolase n=1 Tax=Tieghemostelium lacteum TaxID=361077 RepID=A0A151ZHL3_TIELA|nr:haloacid dehalogenase-like hydrolase [Tieghemostelium lacteum]|eukprot:KYQ93478.1 haloacid dehalogenase-like hydrolase [Tieghemostelium lacteum]
MIEVNNTKKPIDISKIHTLFFDLDNTLYPKSCGLAGQVSKRITQYMGNILQLPEEQVDKIRNQYYQTYGLTLKGLMQHHSVDIHHYLDYVHGGLELQNFLKNDDRLRAILGSINPLIKKIIFSNADLGHCQRVMKALNINDQFDGILEYLELMDYSKPHPTSYQMAMKKAQTTDPSGCVFFDDVVDNLVAAKDAGFITVLVGSSTDNVNVDFSISEIHDLVTIFPHLIMPQHNLQASTSEIINTASSESSTLITSEASS